MSVHEQFAEDLALYALGCLEGGEKASLEKHLEECASCRRELEQLRGDAALLALSASGPRPPARAQTRLMDAIAKEPRGGVEDRRSSRPQWWAAFGWAAAAAMIVVVAVVWNQNTRLKSSIAVLQGLSEQQRFDLGQARHVVDTLTAQDVQRVDVMQVGAKQPPPQGKAIYSRQNNGLIFVASNLLPLPAQKAYELWIIPTQGAPIPAGTFQPDAHGGAMVINPPIPAGVEAKAFAITIEPEQGSTTPTMPIVMIGAGG
jgi:anti-sigma-K factor RskA